MLKNANGHQSQRQLKLQLDGVLVARCPDSSQRAGYRLGAANMHPGIVPPCPNSQLSGGCAPQREIFPSAAVPPQSDPGAARWTRDSRGPVQASCGAPNKTLPREGGKKGRSHHRR
jgi:hypothetical protein